MRPPHVRTWISSCYVTTRGQACTLPLLIENALLRIGQEATANAVSHSQASELAITITYRKDSVSLRIEDNGSGFNVDVETNGFGLAGIRRRAVTINAEVLIDSAPGKGTSIEVTAPIPSRARWAEWLAVHRTKRSVTGVLGTRKA